MSFDDIELEDERIVEMIVLEPEVIDKQKHIVSASEIEEGKALWDSMSQTIGIQHRNKRAELYNLENFNPEDPTWQYGWDQDFEIVSSIICPQDTVINNQKVRQGSWLLTLEVLNNDIWQAIQEEKLTGASIGAMSLLDKVNGHSRISNLIPLEVSLVERPAIGRRFLRKELDLEEVIGSFEPAKEE